MRLFRIVLLCGALASVTVLRAQVSAATTESESESFHLPPELQSEADPVEQFWSQRLPEQAAIPELGEHPLPGPSFRLDPTALFNWGGSSSRQDPPPFTVPVRRMVLGADSSRRLDRLPAELQKFSDLLLATGGTDHDTAYDWFFPQVYANVTKEIQAELAHGGFHHPESTLQEALQFYEIYAANVTRWLQHGKAEAAWDSTARLSRAYGDFDRTVGRKRHDRLTFSARILFASMYSHIEVDLPRALMMIYYEHLPAHETAENRAQLLNEMVEDFKKLTPAFDRAVAHTMDAGQVSWENLSQLPAYLRFLIERAGAGPLVRVMRSSALRRFARGARQNKFRGEMLAIPGVAEPTALPAVPTAPVQVAAPFMVRAAD